MANMSLVTSHYVTSEEQEPQFKKLIQVLGHMRVENMDKIFFRQYQIDGNGPSRKKIIKFRISYLWRDYDTIIIYFLFTNKYYVILLMCISFAITASHNSYTKLM